MLNRCWCIARSTGDSSKVWCLCTSRHTVETPDALAAVSDSLAKLAGNVPVPTRVAWNQHPTEGH